jgi:hypothetical protein
MAETMPSAAAPVPPTVRCIQRPTGEWFTFAAANAPGKDTPDATDLHTEAEIREQLRALGMSEPDADARIEAARTNAEVSGDELPLPDPVIGGPPPSVAVD